ncbi:hypothetical protein GCM10028793_63120 [Nocardiopsis oceani]
MVTAPGPCSANSRWAASRIARRLRTASARPDGACSWPIKGSSGPVMDPTLTDFSDPFPNLPCETDRYPVYSEPANRITIHFAARAMKARPALQGKDSYR